MYGGLSLIRFASLLVLFGVVLSLAVPYGRDAAERSRASGAVYYLTEVRASQEAYRAENGAYADSLSKLDLEIEPPAEFRVSELSAGDSGSTSSSWRLTLTRVGRSSFGEYSVVFSDSGFDPLRSSIDETVPFDYLLAGGTDVGAGVVSSTGAGDGTADHSTEIPTVDREDQIAETSVSCGEAAAPTCDGQCLPGRACVVEKDRCKCITTSTPCGSLAAPPLCYGVCPEGNPCVEMGGTCRCAP